ncbi:MAG TPA: YbaY family lipoprotein [Alicycliphilus sp.]|nr:YbaY family lipoprotein [Alicycliphilus sp.]
MQHLEGQVIWPADTEADNAGLTLTVQLRDVALQDVAAPLVAQFVAAVAAPAAGQASAFRLDWNAPGQGGAQLALQARVVDGNGHLRFISTEHVAAAPGARVRLQRVG